MKISLDTIYHYTKISLTYWLYFPNYVSYLWLMYFPIGSLHLFFFFWKFTPFNFPLPFLSSPLPPSSCNHLFVLGNYNCFYFITSICFFFFFKIPYINEIIQYLSLSDLISLSVIPLLIHPCCCRWQDFILFYGWITFHCMYISSFL